MDNNKKEKELNILNKLFRNEVNIRKCEQPDFILTYGELVSYGVEITEFYYNSASARLKNKNGYIKDLIEHQKYIHKDDKKLLKVHEIKYYSQIQPNNPINMNALFFPKFRMENLRQVLLNLLKQKNEKLKKYSNDIRECMLVIYDCENKFDNIHPKDIMSNLFDEKLINEIRESQYYEIYFITTLQGKEHYIPFKAYSFLSEAFILADYIKENNLIYKLEELNQDILDVYAEVLLHRGFKQVIGSLYDNKKVVYCKRYGIGLEFGPDSEWGFRIYDIYPLPLEKVDIIGEYCLDKESDFFSLDEFETYNKATKDKILSVGMHFKIL